MSTHIVSANDLADGRVVYLMPDDGWSRDPRAAAVANSEAATAALLASAEAAARAGRVVSPLAVPIIEGSDPPLPIRNKDRIRAAGPSVRADFSEKPDVPL